MVKLSFVLYLALFVVCANALAIRGGPRPISDEAELAELSQNVTDLLKKLANQENGPQLAFVKIHSATSQTVGGRARKALIAVIENTIESNCSISLYERPWEDYVKFDADCGENKKYLWTTGEQRKKRSIQGFGFGAPAPASRAELDALHPRLNAAFANWRQSHPQFNIKCKSVKSGTSQVVTGTIYNVIIEDEQSTEWQVRILENLDGNFQSITLTIPGKQYLLKF